MLSSVCPGDLGTLFPLLFFIRLTSALTCQKASKCAFHQYMYGIPEQPVPLTNVNKYIVIPHDDLRPFLDVRSKQPPDSRFLRFRERAHLPSCQFRFQGSSILPADPPSRHKHVNPINNSSDETAWGYTRLLLRCRSSGTLFFFGPRNRFGGRRKGLVREMWVKRYLPNDPSLNFRGDSYPDSVGKSSSPWFGR